MNQAYYGDLTQGESQRTFLFKTYFHLFIAIMLFIAIQFVGIQTGATYWLLAKFSGVSWLLILGLFMVSSWFASNFAMKAVSKPSQYLGLFFYVLVESFLFIFPIGYIIASGNFHVLETASYVTMFLFAALTFGVFVTKTDFSFLRSALMLGGVAAMVLIVVSILFGYNLGIYFTVAMITLAAGSILYNTSNVLRTYPHDRYVAASLSLFSSIALLFWYVLRFYQRD